MNDRFHRNANATTGFM